jgi:RNA polymerase sigma-70 factor (ECF subfamily)
MLVGGDLFQDVPVSPFESLLERVRAGDEAAEEDFFRTYAPHVRKVVGAVMRLESMRRFADSSDICQSVMASFFVRAALGQYDVATPRELIALLSRMARNKVASLARQPERRMLVVPVAAPDLSGVDPPDTAKGPASQVMWKELLQNVRERFTDEERRVSDLRMLGFKWEEVSEKLGVNADAARKRLDRALERVARELSLEELSGE